MSQTEFKRNQLIHKLNAQHSLNIYQINSIKQQITRLSIKLAMENKRVSSC